MSCTVSGIAKVGGLVGFSYDNSIVDNSYASGRGDGTGKGAGGLVGEIYQPTGSCSITGCKSLAPSVSGTTNVGSFVGWICNTSDGTYFSNVTFNSCGCTDIF